MLCLTSLYYAGNVETFDAGYHMDYQGGQGGFDICFRLLAYYCMLQPHVTALRSLVFIQ